MRFLHLPFPDRHLIENVIHCYHVTGQLAIWILKGLWIIFCFILKMNFVPSIMNPIYVLIFYALEACGLWPSPLTLGPNKEIGCFLILISFLERLKQTFPISSVIGKAQKKHVCYIIFFLQETWTQIFFKFKNRIKFFF